MDALLHTPFVMLDPMLCLWFYLQTPQGPPAPGPGPIFIYKGQAGDGLLLEPLLERFQSGGRQKLVSAQRSTSKGQRTPPVPQAAESGSGQESHRRCPRTAQPLPPPSKPPPPS
eukprot:5308800-Prymnesium_polylepis.1